MEEHRLTHLDLVRLNVTAADLDNLFGVRLVPHSERVSYPIRPFHVNNRTNGSYDGMSWMTVCQIYKRCYDTYPPYPLFQSYEEGTLCSRTDNAPFWIRDMLAYRQARINQRRYGRKIYELLVTQTGCKGSQLDLRMDGFHFPTGFSARYATFVESTAYY